MKKTILVLLLPLAILSAIAQNKTIPEKKFKLGLGFGAGVFTSDLSIINASLDLQGEYKVSQAISLYSSLAYNRLFSFNSSGGAGYASLLAGPRAWFSEKFFIGMGAGIALATGGGSTSMIFNYNPHIGLNTKKAQFTLGYNALTKSNNAGEFNQSNINIGFIQLRALVKFK